MALSAVFQKQQEAAHLHGALLPKKQILHERLLQAAWQKDAVRSLRPLCDFKLPPPQSKQSSHILLSLSAYAVDTFIIEHQRVPRKHFLAHNGCIGAHHAALQHPAVSLVPFFTLADIGDTQGTGLFHHGIDPVIIHNARQDLLTHGGKLH